MHPNFRHLFGKPLFSVPGYGLKQGASFTELTQQRRNQWTEPALSSLPHLQDIVLLANQGKRDGVAKRG